MAGRFSFSSITSIICKLGFSHYENILSRNLLSFLELIKKNINRLTRKRSDCSVFGQPKSLPSLILPTNKDAISVCQKEQMIVLQLSSKEMASSDICKEMILFLLALWEPASIFTVSPKRIKNMLKGYHKQF